MAEAAQVLSATRRTIEIVNPTTLERVAVIAATSPEELTDAAERARVAQVEWARLPFAERAAAVRRFRDALLDADERFADVLTAETGKPRADAWAVELAYVCDVIGYWLKNGERYLSDERVTPHL